jgi:hypothetical protein
MALRFTFFTLISCLFLTNCASVSRRTIAEEAGHSTADCAIKTGATYPTVDIRPSVLQKDKNRGLQVYYFTAQTREQHRFVVFEGSVYSHDCTVMVNPDGGGQVNYVMDAAGNFYWVDENKNPQTRHSAVFDAGPVAGAGNIDIENSQIISVDSDSGHYPSGPIFKNVLTQLQLDGVDLSQVNVTKTLNN